MADEPNLNEKELTQASALIWERYWNDFSANRTISDPKSFSTRLKRFFSRSGGVELAYRIIKQELGSLNGKLILEAGCGVADNSLRLAESGGEFILFDTSISALKFARRRSEAQGADAFPVQGSIFHLPFKEYVFDRAFNVGVLDHFTPEYRKLSVREMLRVVDNKSKLVIVTNDARSIIHPIAMKHAKKKGTWRFGFKDAVSSLKDELGEDFDSAFIKEYSRGFISQFEFLHYFLPQKGIFRSIAFKIYYLLTFPLNLLNRIPGQYLVTVIEKSSETSLLYD
ncbi:MAG: class I SAM-dependent methyltransferase [candidate division Zixibacteria bacterium]|nr:class I SAM-dependent methyltransferase [Candidatus Tariuqbacter arcticus]